MSSIPSAVAQEAARVEPGLGERREPLQTRLGFTASGSEYFRIWIVNLLLTLGTLGLYYPWARVRKLRYFYGNTQLAGHAFDFHGDPKKMLRGYLLVGLLGVLYSAAGHLAPVAGLVALVIVAGIWPALLRASMQFRLANTSWRGLRFHFTGSTAQAYRSLLPLFVPAILFIGATLWMTVPDGSGRIVPGYGFPFALLVLLAVLATPWAWFLLKKYQHDNYALGIEQTTLRTGVGSFYAVSLKTGLVAMLAVLVMGVLIGVSAGAVFASAARGARPGVAAFVALGVLAALCYALFFAVAGAYAAARTQNLLWNRTVSPHLRFRSELRFKPLLALTVKNWLLVLLTLGLYWPFAKVAVARLRVEAMTLLSHTPLETLAGGVRARADDASGDAAGEFFGIDIGL